MHKDGSILFLDESSNTAMIEHGSEPETWDTSGAILDILNIT